MLRSLLTPADGSVKGGLSHYDELVQFSPHWKLPVIYLSRQRLQSEGRNLSDYRNEHCRGDCLIRALRPDLTRLGVGMVVVRVSILQC